MFLLNMKDNEEEIKKFTETYLRELGESVDIRGRVILATILIEERIDKVIARYFCKKEKEQNFIFTFLRDPGIGFGIKTRILERILKEISYPKAKTTMDHLNKIGSIRNLMAHSLEHNKSMELKEYSLRNIFNGKNQKTENIYDKFNLFEGYINKINPLLNEIYVIVLDMK